MQELNKYKQDLLAVGIPESILSNCFIAGGAIRSLVLGEDIKDVDIFCRTPEDLANMIESLRYGPRVGSIIETENAVSFTLNGTQFQIIKVKTGTPEEVIGEFDFIMNMNYYDFSTNSVYHKSLMTIYDKKLEINPNCRNKLGTLARLEKFLSRGYKIGSRTSLLRLGTQISALDPIKTFTELENESKLYVSFEEYQDIDFVEKDAGSKFVSKYHGSAF